ncbi:restriction endonuclease [Streptomyces albidoflavus]|uniref:restriction endonuclease n=1 Tax=Streptomyces albidoflavus TaxID=1886 RepID=UPI00101F0DB3|nr:restriction endonuclease [Streptomyces albidoflavus]MBV7652706.1 restriction endonuclease [Streptomyces albidoflavus]MBV7714175.1 restriction endonuclease [Streptomyces albidoflavus]RZE14614.1 restriction endonuclease [Streptomyces albidoflavus]
MNHRPPDQAAEPAPSTYTVLHDPEGLIEEQLPLDRHPYESLVKAVLTWTTQDTLTSCDYQQIALQLTGHARAVASDVRRQADRLPKGTGPRALAELVLQETDRCLTTPLCGTARCAQDRARAVRALYECLDRLDAALASEGTSGVAPTGG